RVEALAVDQAVDLHVARLVRGQDVEDRRRRVDRVAPHPRPRGVGADAVGAQLRAHGAVASALHLGRGRLTEDGEVAGEQLRAGAGDAAQAVEVGGDLL